MPKTSSTKTVVDRTGTRASAFCLPDQNGQKVCLRDLCKDARYVLLFFYPRDLTPGCTREAIGFTKAKRRFSARGVRVVGISKLDAASKARFAAKHKLTVPLLADEDCAVADKYGVWREKVMYGKKVKGIARESFLIDAATRKIVHHFTNVKPDTHPEEVLAVVDALRKKA